MTSFQVLSNTKEHALNLWIHLQPNVDVKKILRVATDLQNYVDEISPPETTSDEILAGVGFGSKFYSKVRAK